jgi:aminocarboxymuconate-semialdehyde decarboxylase
MIVDFHNHYFPPAFVDAARAGSTSFRVTTDEDGNPVLHSPGDYNVLVPGHRDLARRAHTLGERGIDVQVLTLTAPGTSLETPERAVELARIVNDALAEAAREGGGRFAALGHLPMQDPVAAAAELERCADELELPGVMVYSNAGGVPLADDRFTPVWEAADRHGSVVYIHPTFPLGVEAMESFMLMPLVGFVADTTLAAAHLAFAGVPDRFPRIRWALSHLGGTIPYLAERLDRGWEAYPASRERLARPPSSVLREFYYDTVNFDPGALELAIRFAGAGHILAGSDYPHMIGSLDRMLSSVRQLGLDPTDEEAVLGGNAERLLGLS